MKFTSLLIILFFLVSCDKPNEAVTGKTIEINTVLKTPDILSEVLDFKQLTNFELPLPDQTMADQADLEFINEALPESVRKLNGKTFIIKGFMIPLQYTKDEKVASFLLAPDQGACCLGKAPALNGIIYCSTSTPYPDLRDILLEVKGKLSTTAEFNKTDNTVYVYKMKVDGIKELKLMPPPKGPGLSF